MPRKKKSRRSHAVIRTNKNNPHATKRPAENSGQSTTATPMPMPVAPPTLDTSKFGRTKGRAHLPFKHKFGWSEKTQYSFQSKDKDITATILPEPHGTYRLVIECGSFFTLDEAMQSANMQLLVLVDEHGHARTIDDIDQELLQDMISSPKLVTVKENIANIAEEFYEDEEPEPDEDYTNH